MFDLENDLIGPMYPILAFRTEHCFQHEVIIRPIFELYECMVIATRVRVGALWSWVFFAFFAFFAWLSLLLWQGRGYCAIIDTKATPSEWLIWRSLLVANWSRNVML
jgi:hypothetical protein